MEFIKQANQIYVENEMGNRIAEVTFPDVEDGVVTINHTFVDNSLRGQGVAGQLLEEAANQLRAQKKKAIPTCSYAVQWFEKHPEYSDVLK